MKKRYILLLAVFILAAMLLLTACGKYTCDLCGQEKSSTKHTTNIYGHKMTICDECYETMNSIGSMIQGFGGMGY